MTKMASDAETLARIEALIADQARQTAELKEALTGEKTKTKRRGKRRRVTRSIDMTDVGPVSDTDLAWAMKQLRR